MYSDNEFYYSVSGDGGEGVCKIMSGLTGVGLEIPPLLGSSWTTPLSMAVLHPSIIFQHFRWQTRYVRWLSVEGEAVISSIHPGDGQLMLPLSPQSLDSFSVRNRTQEIRARCGSNNSSNGRFV